MIKIISQDTKIGKNNTTVTTTKYKGKATKDEAICAIQSIVNYDDLLEVRNALNNFIGQLEK